MSTSDEAVDFRTTLEAERLIVAERAVEAKAPRPPRSDTWWRHVVAILAVIVAVFPAAYVVSAAFNGDPSISSASLIPRELTLDNFRALFNPPVRRERDGVPELAPQLAPPRDLHRVLHGDARRVSPPMRSHASASGAGGWGCCSCS